MAKGFDFGKAFGAGLKGAKMEAFERSALELPECPDEEELRREWRDAWPILNDTPLD